MIFNRFDEHYVCEYGQVYNEHKPSYEDFTTFRQVPANSMFTELPDGSVLDTPPLARAETALKCGACNAPIDTEHSTLTCALQLLNNLEGTNVAEFFPVVWIDCVEQPEHLLSGEFSVKLNYFIPRLQHWVANPATAISYADQALSKMGQVLVQAIDSSRTKRVFQEMADGSFPKITDFSRAEKLGSMIPAPTKVLTFQQIKDLRGIMGKPPPPGTTKSLKKKKPLHLAFATEKKTMQTVPYLQKEEFHSFRGAFEKRKYTRNTRPYRFMPQRRNYLEILQECKQRIVHLLVREPEESHPAAKFLLFPENEYSAFILNLSTLLPNHASFKHEKQITNVACCAFIAEWNTFAISKKIKGLTMVRRPSFGYPTPYASDGAPWHIRFGVGAFHPDHTKTVKNIMTKAIHRALDVTLNVLKALKGDSNRGPSILPEHHCKLLGFDIAGEKVGGGMSKKPELNKLILEAFLSCFRMKSEAIKELYTEYLGYVGDEVIARFMGDSWDGKAEDRPSDATDRLLAVCISILKSKDDEFWLHPLHTEIHTWIDTKEAIQTREHRSKLIQTLFSYTNYCVGKLWLQSDTETTSVVTPHPAYVEPFSDIIVSPLSQALFSVYIDLNRLLYQKFHDFVSSITTLPDSLSYDSVSEGESVQGRGSETISQGKRVFFMGRQALSFCMLFIKSLYNPSSPQDVTVGQYGIGMYYEFKFDALRSNSEIKLITPHAYPNSSADATAWLWDTLNTALSAGSSWVILDVTCLTQDPLIYKELCYRALKELPRIQTILTFSSEHKIGTWGQDIFPMADARIFTKDKGIHDRWLGSLRELESVDPAAVLSRLWRQFLDGFGIRHHLSSEREIYIPKASSTPYASPPVAFPSGSLSTFRCDCDCHRGHATASGCCKCSHT